MEKLTAMYYMSKNGNVPMDDFLEKLNLENREKVVAEVDKIHNCGIDYLKSHSKPLKNAGGLFEFRIRGIHLAIRLLYYYGKNNNIIVTHGIIKRTGQTPEKEKRVAKRYYNDWCARGN